MTMKKHYKAVNLPMLDWLMFGGWRSIVVERQALQDLIDIEERMQVLAPIGDDNRRGLWIYVHRGLPSAWYTRQEALDEGVIEHKEDYLKKWREHYPDKGRWFFVETSCYHQGHLLIISDGAGHYCSIKSYHNSTDDRSFADFEWFTTELLQIIRETVEDILNNVANYNHRVAAGLDYRQRMGRIPRAYFNKICPGNIIHPKDPGRAQTILKEIIEHPREPLGKMTIRDYCHYYKIACLAESHLRDYLDYNKENLDFYRQGNIYQIPSHLRLDSEKSFRRFAHTDHFGELKCYTARLRATKYYTPRGWMFYLSYDTYFRLNEVMDIMVVLYDAGAPLLVQDADKLLAILEEKDYVLLYGDSDWRSAIGPKEGTCTSLPERHMCGIDGNMTHEQREALIQNAEWLPVPDVAIDMPVPLEHPVYQKYPSTESKTVGELLQLAHNNLIICFDIRFDTNGYYPYGHSNFRFRTYNEAVLMALQIM